MARRPPNLQPPSCGAQAGVILVRPGSFRCCRDRASDAPRDLTRRARVWVVRANRTTGTAAVTERAVDRRAAARRGSAQRELTYQRRVLRRIALGAPLSRTLDGLCRHVERQYPSAHCTVLLMDRAAGVLRHGACPSLPRAYSRGDRRAAGRRRVGGLRHRGRPRRGGRRRGCAHRPADRGLRRIARRFGLASVWSQPLRRADGEVLGTFAVYRSEPHRPTRSEIRGGDERRRPGGAGDRAQPRAERARGRGQPRLAHRSAQPCPLPGTGQRAPARRTPARRWCSSRSTGSSRSTTPSAAGPASGSCWSSPSGCAPSSAMRASSHGWATTRSR